MLDPTFSIRLAIAVFRATRRRFQVVGSTSWPITDGRIFGGGAVEPDDLQSWMAVITYNYSAFGEYYSGTYRRGFRRKKKAEAFLERFPRNTPIPVRYKPNRPDISTLLLTDVELLLAGL
jgi:hypothetical protein